MSDPSKPRPMFKFWLETDEGYVFGPGVYSLLKKVEETGTLKEAAETLSMSYRFAWGLVKKAEAKLGQPLIHAHKGGRAGGGGAELTDLGQQYLEEFAKIELLIDELSREPGPLVRPRSVNQVEAEVLDMKAKGEETEFTLQLEEAAPIRVSVSKKLIEGLDITPGDTVSLEMTSTVEVLKKKEA